MALPAPRLPLKAPDASKIGSPLTLTQIFQPEGVLHSSRSRKGLRASSKAMCAAQSASLMLSYLKSQRFFPLMIHSGPLPEEEVKRYWSSCSQYMSEDSPVRLRKRRSLSSSSFSTCSPRFRLDSIISPSMSTTRDPKAPPDR